MSGGQGGGKFSKENLTHFVPNVSNNTSNGRVNSEKEPIERETIMQKQENEAKFCRALLAGIHGVEPEELTQEFLENAKAESLKAMRLEAEREGLKMIKPGNAKKHLEEQRKRLFDS